MEIEQMVLQSSVIQAIAKSYHGSGLNKDQIQNIQKTFPPEQCPSEHQIMETIWALIAQGLAYIDYTQPHAGNWDVHLTRTGKAAASDGAINPDNSSQYLDRLRQLVPQLTDTVFQYTREAVITYTNRCYLASAVMLGVASEAAFLEMAGSFGIWIPNGNERKAFLAVIESKKQNYIQKFIEFRKRIETYKGQLPDEIADSLALTLDSVLDLLRIYRNSAGHPTGKNIDREDAFINLQMFSRYLQKLYIMKGYFDTTKAP